MARKTKQTYEKPWANNPWYEGHRQAEFDYTDPEYTPRMAQNRVDMEWASYGATVCTARTCPGCLQETLWMRPTVLGWVCVNCRYVIGTGRLWDWEDTQKDVWMTYRENLIAA